MQLSCFVKRWLICVILVSASYAQEADGPATIRLSRVEATKALLASAEKIKRWAALTKSSMR